jgi:hypothetical protein
VYLSFGEGRHVDELHFSILSAARFLKADSDWRIVLYTDRSEPFAQLPVEPVLIDGETVASWIGPHHYVWRTKIKVIAGALASPGTSRCVYVDGDTYFLRSPAALFSRVAPGKSLLHLREGWPPPPEVAAVDHVLRDLQPVDTSGAPWRFGSDRASWNAGVVGLHGDDAHLCREVEHLTDQLLEHGFGDLSHTSEQVAFTVCLDQRTTLRPAHDVVMHYWDEDLRQPFQGVLRETLADDSLSSRERFRRLWAERPRESGVRRVKGTVKRLAWQLGVRV